MGGRLVCLHSSDVVHRLFLRRITTEDGGDSERRDVLARPHLSSGVAEFGRLTGGATRTDPITLLVGLLSTANESMSSESLVVGQFVPHQFYRCQHKSR